MLVMSSDVMLNFSKSSAWKAWEWVNSQQMYIFGWTILLRWHLKTQNKTAIHLDCIIVLACDKPQILLLCIVGGGWGTISFHGVVYMDLVPLLYPGVRRIHGVYRIYPFMSLICWIKWENIKWLCFKSRSEMTERSEHHSIKLTTFRSMQKMILLYKWLKILVLFKNGKFSLFLKQEKYLPAW